MPYRQRGAAVPMARAVGDGRRRGRAMALRGENQAAAGWLRLAMGAALAGALAWGMGSMPCDAKSRKAKPAAAGTITARDGVPLSQAAAAPKMDLSPSGKAHKQDDGSLRLNLEPEKPREARPIDPLSGSTSTSFGDTQVDMGWKLRGTNLSMSMRPGGGPVELTSKLEVRDKRMKVGVRMPF